MKKLVSIIFSMILLLAVSVPTMAAGTSSVVCSSANEVKRGETITVTVSLKDVAAFKSMSISPVYDKTIFSLESGEWLLTGATLSDFNKTKETAAIAFSEAAVRNQNVFKYVLKAKEDAAVGNTNASVSVVIKNGASSVDATVVAKTIKVTCKTHNWGEWQVTKKENCTAKGSEKKVCSVCNASESGERKALGHSMGSWSQSKASTCESKGEQKRTCTRTGCTHYETKAIDALGHAFSKAVVTKKPTCTETGIESGTCTRCNKKTTNTLKAKGHTMGKYTVTLEATCVAEGKEEASCTVCGTKSEKTIAVVDHKYGEAVVTKPATETETGISTKTCTVCGNVVEEEIPMISDATDENIADEKDDIDDNIDVNSDANEDVVDEEGFDIGGLIWIIIALVLIALIAYLLFKKKK